MVIIKNIFLLGCLLCPFAGEAVEMGSILPGWVEVCWQGKNSFGNAWYKCSTPCGGGLVSGSSLDGERTSQGKETEYRTSTVQVYDKFAKKNFAATVYYSNRAIEPGFCDKDPARKLGLTERDFPFRKHFQCPKNQFKVCTTELGSRSADDGLPSDTQPKEIVKYPNDKLGEAHNSTSQINPMDFSRFSPEKMDEKTFARIMACIGQMNTNNGKMSGACENFITSLLKNLGVPLDSPAGQRAAKSPDEKVYNGFPEGSNLDVSQFKGGVIDTNGFSAPASQTGGSHPNSPAAVIRPCTDQPLDEGSCY